MTPSEFLLFAREFFDECLEITKAKNSDYSPDNVTLGEVIETALDFKLSVPQALGVHLRKHWSAITTHVTGIRPLRSESIDNRLHDAINYILFLHLWETRRIDIVTAMMQVTLDRSCTCPPDKNGDTCHRCTLLVHIFELQTRP